MEAGDRLNGMAMALENEEKESRRLTAKLDDANVSFQTPATMEVAPMLTVESPRSRSSIHQYLQ